MAPDPDKTLLDLTKAVEELTSMLDINNQKLDSAVHKQTESRKKSRTQESKLLESNLLQNRMLQQNTLRMWGMIKGMTQMHSMLQGVKENNDRLTRTLARTGELTNANYHGTLSVFRNANVSMAQAVQAVETMVSEGIGRFGTEVKLLAGYTKVLGISTKGSMQSIRFNTQALGMSETQSVNLASTLITTARQFGSSIDGLISAVNSMKESLINTTAELGPGMAQSVQQAAIMLGGTTTEAQDMITDFITSITAGPEAFLKAARLGVTMTPGMTGAQVAQATLQALAAAQAIAPSPGPGSQFALAALEERNVLSRKDLVLATMMQRDIKQMSHQSLEDAVSDIGRFSMDQAWQNALYRIQELAMGATIYIAEQIQRFGKIIPWMSAVFGIFGGIFVILKGIGKVFGIGGGHGALKGFEKGVMSRFTLLPRAIAGAGAAVHGRIAKTNILAFGRIQGHWATRLLAKGFAPLQAALVYFGTRAAGGGKGRAIGSGIGAAIGGIALPAAAAALAATGIGIPLAIALGVAGSVAGQKIGGMIGGGFDAAKAGKAPPFATKISKAIEGITGSDKHIQDFLSQQNEHIIEGERTRKAQLRELEDTNRMMRGSLEGNAADSPLASLADDIALQVQGLNQLIDLATTGNDTRDASLDTLRKNIGGFRGAIGIVNSGG